MHYSVRKLQRIWFLGKSLRSIFLGVISLPRLDTRKRWKMHHVRRGERKLKESNYRLSFNFDENLDGSLNTDWSMHSKRSELLKSAEILLISCGGYSRADYSVAAWSPSSALIWIGTNRILKSYHVIVRYR